MFFAMLDTGDNLIEIVLSFFKLGYSPVQKLTEANNGTPLHLAATEGHVLISHILVQAGAELDAIDDEQNTSLMLACIKGKVFPRNWILFKIHF